MGQLTAALEGEDGTVLQGDAVARDQGGRHLVAVVLGLGHGQGGFVTEALDIQGASRAHVGEALGDLRGAGTLVRAAQVDVAFLLLDSPQEGRCVGITNARSDPLRASSTGATISGMTSPALRRTTRSPMRTPLRATSWALCKVARATFEPRQARIP